MRAARRWLAGPCEVLLLALVVALPVAADSGPPPVERLSEWARGPVRWILRPVERRQMRRVKTPAEAANFVERFWARRDPDRKRQGNPYRDLFYQRVEAANLLYPEGELEGSMTDRGRALILLGPPSSLRVASRPALKWNPEKQARNKVTTRLLPMEVWGYDRSALSKVLAESLATLGDSDGVTLSFVAEPDRTYLVEGEEFLELAARVIVAKPH